MTQAIPLGGGGPKAALQAGYGNLTLFGDLLLVIAKKLIASAEAENGFQKQNALPTALSRCRCRAAKPLIFFLLFENFSLASFPERMFTSLVSFLARSHSLALSGTFLTRPLEKKNDLVSLRFATSTWSVRL